MSRINDLELGVPVLVDYAMMPHSMFFNQTAFDRTSNTFWVFGADLVTYPGCALASFSTYKSAKLHPTITYRLQKQVGAFYLPDLCALAAGGRKVYLVTYGGRSIVVYDYNGDKIDEWHDVGIQYGWYEADYYSGYLYLLNTWAPSTLYKIDVSTGTVVYETSLGGLYSSMSIWDGKVYVRRDDNHVVRFSIDGVFEEDIIDLHTNVAVFCVTSWGITAVGYGIGGIHMLVRWTDRRIAGAVRNITPLPSSLSCPRGEGSVVYGGLGSDSRYVLALDLSGSYQTEWFAYLANQKESIGVKPPANALATAFGGAGGEFVVDTLTQMRNVLQVLAYVYSSREDWNPPYAHDFYWDWFFESPRNLYFAALCSAEFGRRRVNNYGASSDYPRYDWTRDKGDLVGKYLCDIDIGEIKEIVEILENYGYVWRYEAS